MGGIEWQTVPSIGAALYPAIEYMDATREQRTGVTKLGQGLDPDVLQNQSATAAALGHSAAQMRTKLIARICAETGIKDLFQLLHAIVKKHGDKPSIVRLRNQWVPIDPRNWKTRDDLTVNVGLGNGGRAEQAAMMTNILNVQKEIMVGGLTNVVSAQQVYNASQELTKAMGHKDGEQFFTDPSKQPPLQPKPDPKVLELQMKGQIEQQSLQMKAQMEQQKQQNDMQDQQARSAADIAIAQKKFQLEAELAMLDARLKQSQYDQDSAQKTQAHGLAMQKGQFDLIAAQHAHEIKMTQAKANGAAHAR